jgi:hypothetical protein
MLKIIYEFNLISLRITLDGDQIFSRLDFDGGPEGGGANLNSAEEISEMVSRSACSISIIVGMRHLRRDTSYLSIWSMESCPTKRVARDATEAFQEAKGLARHYYSSEMEICLRSLSTERTDVY